MNSKRVWAGPRLSWGWPAARFLLEDPGIEVTIDLEARTLTRADRKRITFPVDGFARYCLLNAMDELDFLLEQEERINANPKIISLENPGLSLISARMNGEMRDCP